MGGKAPRVKKGSGAGGQGNRGGKGAKERGATGKAWARGRRVNGNGLGRVRNRMVGGCGGCLPRR